MAIKDSPIPNADYPRDNAAPHLSPGHKLWYQVQDPNELFWNKYLPYQLLLVRAKKQKDGTVRYSRVPGFQFTMPIPPQEITIDMPIATTTQATLGGIVEVHGGAPFRNIILQGTTGIVPLKGRPATGRSDAGGDVGRFGAAVFAGTVQAVTRTADAANRTFATSRAGGNVFPNINDEDPGDGDNKIPKHSTGYYQYRLLEKFIESYVNMKAKNQVYKDIGDSNEIRLALAIWKDESVFLCSGVQLSKRKSHSDPNLINFTLQLRAWARIQLDGPNVNTFEHEFIARKPNLLAEAFNRFRAARETIDAAKDVLESVITDATSTVTDVLRETQLFIKSGAGLGKTLADLPNTIINEAFPNIVSEWNNLRSQFEGKIPPEVDEQMRELYQLRQSQTPTASSISPSALLTILNTISPSSLKLKPGTLKRINEEDARVENFTRFDFEEKRNILRQAAEGFAFAIGAGSDTYSETYNLNTTTTTRTPTASEYNILFALNEAIVILDRLAASGQIDPPAPTSLEYVAGLAERSGIAFQIPTSKFAVPYPYGVTLERLAAQYLGDANRWHEIATLNGLRAPYVDEEGFKLTLLTNGDENQVMVSDASNLFIGQTVWIVSNTISRVKRHIINIDEITPTQTLITLDGDKDLDRFTTAQQAGLEAFLPGTVNSQQIIYIPSDNAASEDPEVKAVPGVDVFDPLLQVGGIDLLLTQDGDLAITPDGDCRVAFGMANVVQTVRLALATPAGALLQHPEYGIAIPVGISTADADPNELLKAASSYFTNDPMFSGVRSATVAKEGNTVRITLEVGLSGVKQFIPITVQIVK